MKDLMLLTIGLGAGFAICGCMMFYVMATITKNSASAKKYNDETLAALQERNEIDREKSESLKQIASRHL